MADAVDGDAATLEAAARDLSVPMQILAINSPDSSQSDSLHAGARTLNASVEPLDAEGEGEGEGEGDVTAIVRRAASAPVAQRGEQGERWQETGYWLVPLLGLIVAASFRHEERQEAK